MILRLRELYFIDLDGADAFDEIIMLLKKQKKNIFVTGTNILTLHLLQQSREFKKLEKEGKVFLYTSDALKQLGFKLKLSHEN